MGAERSDEKVMTAVAQRMSENNRRVITAVMMVIWLAAGYIFASEPKKFESGDTQSSLIELFTSEGCSSCPPAEKWLSALKSSSDLWKKVVPVAFHVDLLGPSRLARSF